VTYDEQEMLRYDVIGVLARMVSHLSQFERCPACAHLVDPSLPCHRCQELLRAIAHLRGTPRRTPLRAVRCLGCGELANPDLPCPSCRRIKATIARPHASRRGRQRLRYAA
jgi:hypothetical protein